MTIEYSFDSHSCLNRPKVTYGCDEHVDSEVELAASDQEGVVYVALHYVSLWRFLVGIRIRLVLSLKRGMRSMFYFLSLGGHLSLKKINIWAQYINTTVEPDFMVTSLESNFLVRTFY